MPHSITTPSLREGEADAAVQRFAYEGRQSLRAQSGNPVGKRAFVIKSIWIATSLRFSQ
jgi:hypothetical protein